MPHRPTTPGRKRSRWTCVGIGCGTALLLALVALIVVHQLVTYVPPELKPPSGSASQPAPPPPPEAYANLEQQVEEARQAAGERRPQAVTITASEAELNALVARRIVEEGGGSVRAAHLSLGAGTITLAAHANFDGRWLALTATGAPTVGPDGRLRLDIQSARVGRMPLPGRLQRQLQSEVDRALSKAAAQEFGLHLDSITVQPGQIELSGSTIPR